LIITLRNNLKLENISPHVFDELTSRLQFPNPKWIENNRMGRWNRGVPKVLNFHHKIKGGGLCIPRGYLRQLIFLCRRHQIEYKIEDKRRFVPEADFVFSGTLRPFQKQASDIMLSRDFGTLSAPTGSGKTVIALHMIAKRRQPALIIVHTKDLALQWVEKIEQFLSISEDAIGFIGDGKNKTGEKITVALVQSLYKCSHIVAENIGFLVVDECHRCPSRTFTEAVADFDSYYMLGLSATPWRRDNLSKLIFWHLGDMHHEIGRNNLIQSGDILNAEIIVRETNFKTFYDPVTEYSKMLLELTLNDERNRLIASDIAREASENDGVCLVLSDRKKHCETLQTILKYKHKIESELFTGDLAMIQRQEVLKKLDNKDIKVLIATGQLIGEGFDNKNLSSLFLATPIKFSGRLLQYIGRILRPGPDQKRAMVYDFVDVKVDVLMSSANARQRVYRKMSENKLSK
jgi:superfamily II DNA or RNA helicase